MVRPWRIVLATALAALSLAAPAAPPLRLPVSVRPRRARR
jgi:hypothetical protein